MHKRKKNNENKWKNSGFSSCNHINKISVSSQLLNICRWVESYWELLLVGVLVCRGGGGGGGEAVSQRELHEVHLSEQCSTGCWVPGAQKGGKKREGEAFPREHNLSRSGCSSASSPACRPLSCYGLCQFWLAHLQPTLHALWSWISKFASPALGYTPVVIDWMLCPQKFMCQSP